MATKPIAPDARQLIEKLKLSQGYVSDLMNDYRRPSLELALRIERETGLPATYWTSRPKRRRAKAQPQSGAAA